MDQGITRHWWIPQASGWTNWIPMHRHPVGRSPDFSAKSMGLEWCNSNQSPNRSSWFSQLAIQSPSQPESHNCHCNKEIWTVVTDTLSIKYIHVSYKSFSSFQFAESNSNPGTVVGKATVEHLTSGRSPIPGCSAGCFPLHSTAGGPSAADIRERSVAEKFQYFSDFSEHPNRNLENGQIVRGARRKEFPHSRFKGCRIFEKVTNVRICQYPQDWMQKHTTASTDTQRDTA